MDKQTLKIAIAIVIVATISRFLIATVFVHNLLQSRLFWNLN